MEKETLELILKEGEGLRVEFKERYSSKLDRDIVAFANSRGGYLILGVNDKGNIVRETLTNKLKAEIIDLARKCEPSIAVEKISQINDIVVVEIEESREKPHSCSSGFYRRLDAVTQKMTQQEIKIIFKENEKKISFEEEICSDISLVDISEEKIHKFLQEAKISITDFKTPNILESLNLLKGSSIKNAGVLFFAKDPRRIFMHCEAMLIAFKGTERVHIYDRLNVQDDLLTQFDEAILFLKKHLNLRSEIHETKRYDIYEIPIDALREAVANAIIHRDYGVRGMSLMVEVHADRVVISNPGGILEGTDIEMLKQGVSKRRNELIADLFARLDKAEKAGSGLRRIGQLMDEVWQPYPEIQIEGTLFFKMTFRRPFYSEDGSYKSSYKSAHNGSYKNNVKILNIIAQNANISTQQLSELVGISTRAVAKHIAKLQADKLLKRVGSKKEGHWEVIEQNKKDV